MEKQRWVNSGCVTEKTLDLGRVHVPVEVISASQTGTSPSQTQPHQPAVPCSLQPGPTRVRGVGARLVGSGALRSWDVLWEGMSECVESRFSQQWCTAWRRQGLLEGRWKSSQEQHVPLHMCGATGSWGQWGHLRLEKALGERAVAGTDAQGTCLCHPPSSGKSLSSKSLLAGFLSHTGFTEMSNSSGWGCPLSWADSYSCYLIVEGIFLEFVNGCLSSQTAWSSLQLSAGFCFPGMPSL